MRVQRSILLAILIVARTAAPAQAQWVATPYLGINLAGDAEFRRGGPGGSVGYFSGWLGIEFDVQRYNHFFRDDVVDLVPNNCRPGVIGACIDLNTDAWSFMGNVVAPIRVEGAEWRPYGVVGLGAIHAWVQGPGDQYDTSQDNLAFDVGGGVMYTLSSRVGLRGDLRYFKVFVDDDKREGGVFRDYDFWRATVGVTFGFPR